MTRAVPIVLFVSFVLACGPSRPAPAPLQAGTPCSHCRMIVSDGKVAAQIAAAGEEPRFFDDIGCMAAHLREHPMASGAVAYVADHQTGDWIPAGAAVYSRSEQIDTPMGSHIVAHRDAGARAADPSVRGAAALEAKDVFGGAAGGPDGK